MRITKVIKISGIVVITIMSSAACNTSRKSVSSTGSSTPVSTSTTTTTATSGFNYMLTAAAATGIYVPGSKELTAIQLRYKDATLEQLKEGHAIYTQGACISCHTAQNIYVIEESKWENIMEDMAQKARISDAEKDAVYKYVLAVKFAEEN